MGIEGIRVEPKENEGSAGFAWQRSPAMRVWQYSDISLGVGSNLDQVILDNQGLPH